MLYLIELFAGQIVILETLIAPKDNLYSNCLPIFSGDFSSGADNLNVQDYMNYRKYKYLRLDGSSTIMDRRDMVRDFQQRYEFHYKGLKSCVCCRLL